jgi:hypothetical protein
MEFPMIFRNVPCHTRDSQCKYLSDSALEWLGYWAKFYSRFCPRIFSSLLSALIVQGNLQDERD